MSGMNFENLLELNDQLNERVFQDPCHWQEGLVPIRKDRTIPENQYLADRIGRPDQFETAKDYWEDRKRYKLRIPLETLYYEELVRFSLLALHANPQTTLPILFASSDSPVYRLILLVKILTIDPTLTSAFAEVLERPGIDIGKFYEWDEWYEVLIHMFIELEDIKTDRFYAALGTALLPLIRDTQYVEEKLTVCIMILALLMTSTQATPSQLVEEMTTIIYSLSDEEIARCQPEFKELAEYAYTTCQQYAHWTVLPIVLMTFATQLEKKDPNALLAFLEQDWNILEELLFPSDE